MATLTGFTNPTFQQGINDLRTSHPWLFNQRQAVRPSPAARPPDPRDPFQRFFATPHRPGVDGRDGSEGPRVPTGSDDFYPPWQQDVELAKWMAEMASTGRLTDFLTANLIAFGGANAADRGQWGRTGMNGMLQLPNLFMTPPRPEPFDPIDEHRRRNAMASRMSTMFKNRFLVGAPRNARGILVGERGTEVLMPRSDGGFDIVPITDRAATGGSFTSTGTRLPTAPTGSTSTRLSSLYSRPTSTFRRETTPTPLPTPSPTASTPTYPTIFNRPTPTPTPTNPPGTIPIPGAPLPPGNTTPPIAGGPPVTPVGQQPITPTPMNPNLLPSIQALREDRVIPAFGRLGRDLSLAHVGIDGMIPAPYTRAANFWRQPSWIQDQMIEAWQSAIGGGIPAQQIIQWIQEATPGFRRAPTRVMRIA